MSSWCSSGRTPTLERSQLSSASGPDGDALEWQADLRSDEPCRVILVLGPHVAHDDRRAVALDRPARLLGRRLDLGSARPQLEAVGQRHVERLMVGGCLPFAMT